jgi:hypothetical protein
MKHALQRHRKESVPIHRISGGNGSGPRKVAAMHLLVALLVLTAPVGGPVTRAFDVGRNPYEGGRHRGVDLAAARGAVVRAPCAGEVVVAGRVGASGRVVTLRCGEWRVSVMPLARVAVRRGVVVRAGARVGTAAGSSRHAGLHLGVRRDGTRFGYVDPLRFLRAPGSVPPVAVGRRGPRPPRRVAPPARVAAPAAVAVAPAARVAAVAPWPAWAGLALVLGGVGVRWRVRRRARRWRVPGTSTAAG